MYRQLSEKKLTTNEDRTAQAIFIWFALRHSWLNQAISVKVPVTGSMSAMGIFTNHFG